MERLEQIKVQKAQMSISTNQYSTKPKKNNKKRKFENEHEEKKQKKIDTNVVSEQEKLRKEVNDEFQNKLLPLMTIQNKFNDNPSYFAPGAICVEPKKRPAENKLEDLIKKGDFQRATQLSDALFEKSVVGEMKRALATKEHADRLKQEEEESQQHKKPRLHWGFEMKKRWERKSNM
eukprot:c18432_g1_i1.p1 GENE.c18432_g1_i1~~c18432_g1_i1.p1  ORF type:complete len:201 (+),score=77.35 c18432_g1_i1:73-603(+)